MGYGLKGMQMPPQNDDIVRRLSWRWLRAARPHNEWASTAKLCVDFLEGNHWSEEEKSILRQMRRTALTLNMIAPLWRLVMGYQSSNRIDVSYLPTSDSASSEAVAEVLNNIFKSEANRCDLAYTDSDVFADGLTTGRGYWDVELCFDDNDLGEIAFKAADPFSKYIDPDTQSYDLSHPELGASYIQDTVWTNLDCINEKYGSDAAMAVQNVFGPGYQSAVLSYLGENEVSPKRFFGGYADDKDFSTWSDVYYNDFIDEQAKQVRLLDSQYRVTKISPCFVDLETGDKEMIPEEWLAKPQIIDKVMQYAEKRGNHLKIANRPVKRIRRTITCGDVMLFDKWSIYRDYTTVGFFPYFRRGKTRGMVEDLIDAQREANKKNSVLTDIVNRNANSGWMYEENTLDPEQEENLRLYGSSPGINVKYKRKEGSDKPSRIEPGGYPQGLDRLEEKASNRMFDLSGLNPSALGQLDRVQSGRAIEARQRQAVLSIQMYSDNFSRSKKMQGDKALAIFQKFYTEERIYRVMGEDSSLSITEINKKMTTGDNAVLRLNDITVGKYSVHVDEVPISATFKQGQFEETMMIVEKLGPIGMALMQTNPGLIIDQSSLPRKQEWKKALEEAVAAQQAQAQAAGAMPAAAGGAPTDPTATPVGPAAGTPEMMPS